MRKQEVFAALVLGAGLLAAQSERLAFEVASIRPSAPFNGQVTAGVHTDGNQITGVFLSLRDYIRWAYKVKDYQIIGPDWMGSARFDITAKLPAASTQDQIAQMMGALLTDRFAMKMHRESRELPVYALVVAKGGPKLKESEPGPEPDPKAAVNVVANGNSGGTTVDMGHGASLGVGNNKIEGRKMNMAAFAEVLARFTDRPVIDATGLDKRYDLTLEFTPEDFRAMMIRAAVAAGAALPPEALKALDSAPGDSTFSALESVGLKLEPRKAPIEVLVIDHMEKTPTDN